MPAQSSWEAFATSDVMAVEDEPVVLENSQWVRVCINDENVTFHNVRNTVLSTYAVWDRLWSVWHYWRRDEAGNFQHSCIVRGFGCESFSTRDFMLVS